MIADRASHMRAATVFLDEASALWAVCGVRGLVALPICDTIVCLAAAPFTVILLLTELARLHLANGAGNSTAPASRTKVNDCVAIGLRAKHQVLSVLGN